MVRKVSYIQKTIGEFRYPLDARPRTTAFEVSEKKKFEHTWIMAGSGAGKTSLLFREILTNLKRPDPAAMVILDPKGVIMPTLSRLKYFEDNDRLIIVDPADIEYPPALNLFAPPPEKRFRMYSDSIRRQVETQTIDLFSYIFASRGQALSARQANCFEYLSRLMFLIPNATIDTLLDVLSPSTAAERWAPFIGRMSPNAQRWFREQYFPNTYKSTREQIADRLYGITARTECFSTVQRKVDMFELLQERKTVIVNIPMTLGPAGVELFGRYITALTLAAAFERVAHDQKTWVPAFLMMDEAYQFADEEKMAQLLHLAREYMLGVYFVHQDKGQIGEKLCSALGGSTSIKYVSKLGTNDLGLMSRELRCKSDELAAIAPTDTEARFLCYVSGDTPKPVLVTFPFGEMNHEPRMSAEAYQRLIKRNRDLVAIDRFTGRAAPEPTPEPKQATQETHSRPPRDPGDPGDTY